MDAELMDSISDSTADTKEQVVEPTPPTEIGDAEVGRAIHMAGENMCLGEGSLYLQDIVDELKHQLLSERSERQALVAELNDSRANLARAKDLLDEQKRENRKISLQLSAVTAERDELEIKMGDAWHSMAVLEEGACNGKAVNQSLREEIEREKREREAQEVLVRTMAAQLEVLERRLADCASAEEQQRRNNEEQLRHLHEEAQCISHLVDCLAAWLATDQSVGEGGLNVGPQLELLQLQGLTDEREEGGDIPDVAHGAVDSGLNVSHAHEPLSKLGTSVFVPVRRALRYLRQQIEQQKEEKHALQRECRLLEVHIAALKEDLQKMGCESDDMRERLLKCESYQARTLETLKGVRQECEADSALAAGARRRIALLLCCVDDWGVIEQYTSDNIQELKRLSSAFEESQQAHRLYVKRREDEVDRMMDVHQREVDELQQQLEQARHECERYKRAATSSTLASTSHVSTVANDASAFHIERERDLFRAKYQELLHYVENELEPLSAEQARIIKEEKQKGEGLARANDSLRLELKLTGVSSSNSAQCDSGRWSVSEALILVLRVLSGVVADLREMAQQRLALSRYVMRSEGGTTSLNLRDDMRHMCLLLRFRRAVVAVLAANRLLAVQRTMWRSGSAGDVIIPCRLATPIASGCRGRIRLPQETCCIVRRGVVRLPFLTHQVDSESGCGSGEDMFSQHLEADGRAVFVTEQDVQQVLQRLPVPCGGVEETASQGQVLQGLIDSLMGLVVVPAALRRSANAQTSLWQRLAKGLRVANGAPTADSSTTGERRCRFHTQPSPSQYDNHNRSRRVNPHKHASGPDVSTSCPAAHWGNYRCSTALARNALPRHLRPSSFLEIDAIQKESSHIVHNSYPVPQCTGYASVNTSYLEDALRQSLLREEQQSASMLYAQSDSSFTSHVLSAIQALDQHVLNALERRPGLERRV